MRGRCLIAWATLALAACADPQEAGAEGSDDPSPTRASAQTPGTDGAASAPPRLEPFEEIEALRPRPWTSWPVENVDLRGYDGWRIDAVHGGFERDRGLRFEVDRGAFVLAIAEGEVSELVRDDDDRLVLRVDHGQGISSHYGPLSDALVHSGSPLTRGAAIGLAAGEVLHLRVTVDGLDIDPLLALRQPLHRWPGLLRVLPPPAPLSPAPSPSPSPGG